MLEIEEGLSIPVREVVVRASRSSGPGGQHANVTASRVEAVFDVAGSTVLDDRQRSCLLERYGSTVVAVAQDTRGQSRNRELALERLAGKIREALAPRAPRRPTGPSRTARARRLERKRRVGERKRGRRRPAPEDE